MESLCCVHLGMIRCLLLGMIRLLILGMIRFLLFGMISLWAGISLVGMIRIFLLEFQPPVILFLLFPIANNFILGQVIFFFPRLLF